MMQLGNFRGGGGLIFATVCNGHLVKITTSVVVKCMASASNHPNTV